VQGNILRAGSLCKKNSGGGTGCNKQQRAGAPENKRSACAFLHALRKNRDLIQAHAFR
jgi:hypothetical protein